MLCVKIHQSYRDVVAVCDSDLIGKKFEEGKLQLDVRQSFFKDQEVSYEQAVVLLKEYSREDATFNIAGPEAVKAALDAGIISKEGISTIQKVPFALVLG